MSSLFKHIKIVQKHFHNFSVTRNLCVRKLLDDAATYKDVEQENPEDQWSTLPYPEGSDLRRKQSSYSLRPKVDPRDTTIILFPGQGTQYVGMAKGLQKFPMARDLFDLAEEVLKFNLLKLCLEGPAAELNRTENCQLAVFVTSLAALEKLKEERPKGIDNCVATAGFSLGEITALVFAGAIPFDKALKLIQIRAIAMQNACDEVSGGMATVLYGPDSRLSEACIKAKQWCIDKGIEDPECIVANYLYPHCKVVAGNTEALNFLEKNSTEFKLRRVKKLNVNGAFHTNLMKSAVEPFQKALSKIKVDDPVISVHSNIDGKRYKNAFHIKKQLPKQIIKPVKWEQTLHILYERDPDQHFPRTFECGPSASLKPILKQVNAKAWDSCTSIEA